MALKQREARCYTTVIFASFDPPKLVAAVEGESEKQPRKFVFCLTNERDASSMGLLS